MTYVYADTHTTKERQLIWIHFYRIMYIVGFGLVDTVVYKYEIFRINRTETVLDNVEERQPCVAPNVQ